MTIPSAQRAAFMDGVRETVLLTPSYLPFGLVCGVAAANAGLVTPAALALPGLVFGGSSQAVLTQFLQNASALWIAVLSGLVVNLRMAVYSAAMAPYFRQLSTPKRMLAAAFLVDNAFAFLQRRIQMHPQEATGRAEPLLAYYAGLMVVLWPSWVMFCAIGVLAGGLIPNAWQLDFTIPLCFIAVLVTTVRNMPMLAAACAGAVASVALFALPLKLGMIAACLLGLLAGLITERLLPQATQAADSASPSPEEPKS
jgi:predicted branched-subunit amino acid permease